MKEAHKKEGATEDEPKRRQLDIDSLDDPFEMDQSAEEEFIDIPEELLKQERQAPEPEVANKDAGCSKPDSRESEEQDITDSQWDKYLQRYYEHRDEHIALKEDIMDRLLDKQDTDAWLTCGNAPLKKQQLRLLASSGTRKEPTRAEATS